MSYNLSKSATSLVATGGAHAESQSFRNKPRYTRAIGWTHHEWVWAARSAFKTRRGARWRLEYSDIWDARIQRAVVNFRRVGRLKERTEPTERYGGDFTGFEDSEGIKKELRDWDHHRQVVEFGSSLVVTYPPRGERPVPPPLPVALTRFNLRSYRRRDNYEEGEEPWRDVGLSNAKIELIGWPYIDPDFCGPMERVYTHDLPDGTHDRVSFHRVRRGDVIQPKKALGFQVPKGSRVQMFGPKFVEPTSAQWKANVAAQVAEDEVPDVSVGGPTVPEGSRVEAGRVVPEVPDVWNMTWSERRQLSRQIAARTGWVADRAKPCLTHGFTRVNVEREDLPAFSIKPRFVDPEYEARHTEDALKKMEQDVGIERLDVPWVRSGETGKLRVVKPLPRVTEVTAESDGRSHVPREYDAAMLEQIRRPLGPGKELRQLERKREGRLADDWTDAAKASGSVVPSPRYDWDKYEGPGSRRSFVTAKGEKVTFRTNDDFDVWNVPKGNTEDQLDALWERRRKRLQRDHEQVALASTPVQPEKPQSGGESSDEDLEGPEALPDL